MGPNTVTPASETGTVRRAGLCILGNAALLGLPKTAFLCSRRYPARVVLRAYDWAIAQRETGRCVVSGFHSQIERDVLHYLLKGQQPLVVVLARGLKKSVEPAFEAPLAEGRLLIVSPFDANVQRVSERTALIRNRLMLTLADEVLVAHATPGGGLARLLAEVGEGKAIRRFE